MLKAVIRQYHAGDGMRSHRDARLPGTRPAAISFLSGLTCLSFVAAPALAEPADNLPALTIAARETFDAFEVPTGVDPGTAVLNKIQLSGTLRSDQLGIRGWLVHAQVFRFDGRSLSKHLGDIQTADNIEADPVSRLFELYVAKLWDRGEHSVGLRFGLIDLNSQFDSIDVASLMLNSSHGIGPDISRSGRNGPSIYPVTALGSTMTWVKSNGLTFRLGIFGGVAGNPNAPRAFVAEQLKPRNGLLLIGQTDWQITKRSRLEAGAWGYTAAQQGPDAHKALGHGAYVSYEAPLELLPHLNFWLRAGFANPGAQPIAAYLGAGLADQGLFPGRPDDRFGLAIAHAVIGRAAQQALGVHRAETSFELTYQAKISGRLVIQPDVDYIHDPAGVPHAPDSVGVGLRFVYAIAYPIQMTASDPGDPTIPPDGAPTPSDD